jgi:membrane-bound serine protease (ClpP class)
MEPSLPLAYTLIGLGILLLVAELFIPSGGIFFVISLSAIIIGVTMTFLAGNDPMVGMVTLVAVLIAVPVIGGMMLHYWPRSRMGRRFFLNSPVQDATIASMPVHLELEALRGRFGRTVSPLRPSGVVEFDGRRIDSLSEGMLIEPGRWVRCIDVRTGKVIVRVVEKPDLKDLEDGLFT